MKFISLIWVIKSKTTITNKEQAVELWIEIKIISKIAQVPLISKLMENINILILKLMQIMEKVLVRNTNHCNKRKSSKVIQENSLAATILMALIVKWFFRILLNYQMERNKTWSKIMILLINKKMALSRYIRKKK